MSTIRQTPSTRPLFEDPPENQSGPPMPKMEWLSDVAALLPNDAMRKRFLLRVAAYGSDVNLDDPLWGMLDILGLTAVAYRSVVAEMTAATHEMQKLRDGIGEALKLAEEQLKDLVNLSTSDARQLLEDVRSELRESTSPGQIAKLFTAENQKQFELVNKELFAQQLLESKRQLSLASDIVAKKLQTWVETYVGDSVKRSKEAMDAAVRGFRIRLFGQWGLLVGSAFAGGLISAVGLLLSGYFVGKH